MSSTPVQDPATQGLSSGSGQTLPFRPLQPTSDPSASKRVCFYKSGDYKFSGHRLVINTRTFKTFDALLDALSKKVPLPFGVRTITTPRGTHLVRGLDDLQDGGSYVCSDQKRVKPLNMDEVNRRQVPWNTTRPPSASRRKRQGSQFGQFDRRNETRAANITERVAVRTPKKLVVIKNRDPTVKRTIVLQRRTAPTFDSLLDYLSQILQFPVLKLYSTDGRRVDGLAALILCSGVVVAAGNEPFRLGNYSFHRTGQIAQAIYMETIEPSMLLPRAQNNKSFSSGRGSRNFSSSSERYIVNQINKSRNGSRNSHLHHHHGSEVNQHYTSMDTCGTGRGDHEQHTCIVPQDDDIEKSFRVNQDGSMTVEMKVHLTIKEEEMLHWTTTLSRSSLSKRTACASISESGNSSPDSNNAVAKDSSSIEDETKEENHPTGMGKGVGFNNEQVYEGYTSTALGKAKSSFKRTPTPGPRHVKKKTSVESVKMVTESGVQESTLGHSSYMERTADGETTTEGYCIVRHSNRSSSNRPIPKPRKTASADANKKGFNTSIKSSGVAEVLKIKNHGMEVTETVMHIYEGQGCYDNYFANEEYNTDVAAPDSKPSTESGPRSSSNDCDIDFSCQPSTADPLQRLREEILSLSSEPRSPTRETVKEDKVPTTEKRNNEISKPNGNAKGSPSTCSSDKKLSPSRNSKHSSTDKLSNVSMGKKSLSSSEIPKSGQNSKEAKRKAGNPQSKKSIKASRKDSALLVSNSTENMKKTPPQRQSVNKVAARDNSHNVNTPTRRPQVKKNMSDIIQPKKSLLPGKKTISTPKSMIENRIASPKKSLELSESVSMPSLNLTPSQIHQYVENWLEKVSPDQASYTESIPDELEPRAKVVFQIGGDSESEETNECQSKLDECNTLSGVVKKSVSCLSIPLSHEGPETTVLYNEQKPRGLCVSMPSVRVDSVHQENTLRPHKSAEAISPQESESTSSISNILSPKAKIKPVLRQLCSSIQCIRSVSDSNTTSNLEKSNSLPDFSTQVASVFGSSCKAFLSFLSVMTLKDSITGSAVEDGNQAQSTSEAMLMMESLQKISVIEDEEEQRSSLTDLQSRASSVFRERWKDFQIMRERFESEPLSPKVSETEFALDVVSEGGDVFEGQIDELLEELNMPQDLRAEISSTIHQARNFYPVDESTFIETDRNQSDSEEDVEKFVDEHNDDTKQPQRPVSTSIVQDVKEKKQDDDSGDDLNKMQSMYSEQEKITELAQEADEVQETGLDVPSSEVSQTERGEALEIKDESEEKEDQVEEVEQDREEEREEERNQINDYSEENIGNEIEEEKEDMAENEDDEGQEKWEAGKESGCESVVKVEEGTEGEMEIDDAEKGGETDERKMAEEEERDEINEDAADEEENGEESSKKRKKDETQEEADENIEEQMEEEKEEIVPENSAEEDIEEGIEEGEKVEKTAGEDEKEVDMITDNDDEEEPEDVIEETEEEKDLENITDKVEEKEVKNSVEDEGDGDFEESEVADDFNVEVVEKEEEVNVLIENDVEEEKEEIIGDADDEKEKENNLDELEEKQEEEVDTEKDIEEEDEEVIGDTDEEEGVENLIDEVEEREGEVDAVTKKDEEEEMEEVTDETQGEEKDGGEINGEMEEKEEEEVDVAFKNDAEEETEGEEEETINHEVEDTDDDIDVVSEEGEEAEEIINETGEEEEAENINGEGEEEMVGEDCSEEESEDGVAEVRNTEEGRASVITNEDEEEAEGETDEDTDKEEKSNEESRKEFEKQSSLEVEEVEESETGENIRDGQTLDEEEREDDEENEQDEELEQVEQQESNYDIIEEDDVIEDMDSSDNDVDSKNLLQEAFCLQQHCSSHEETNTGYITDSPTKYSSEGQCEYEKGNEVDTADELEIDGGGQTREDRSNSLPHPVEISQELLDFVNSALQSSSLTFTYDARGNIRIEPDNAQVVQTKQTIIPNHRNDSSYGLKRLPSPSTSDLTDYRPETSESGGYKSQDSLDIVTESGEEASEKPFPVCRREINIPDGKMDVERAISKVSVASNSEILQNSGLKSGESLSSYDSGSKVSREDLSYFSATCSSKADAEATECMSLTPGKEEIDGVLIDQGRWLLKENHLIRKSPPVSLGMYGNLDSSSIDTGQENGSEESPPHYKTKQNPLVAISSSELEEMVKPQTLKCTYYNMPHGSDSDPFLDESSIQSGKKETSFVKGRGFRVSPTIDTSKTWSNKNGSLSSFASVEFKMPDSRVHPVGESSAVTQARRTPSGGGSALQAQDSLDTLRMRCGQYCPIL